MHQTNRKIPLSLSGYRNLRTNLQILKAQNTKSLSMLLTNEDDLRIFASFAILVLTLTLENPWSAHSSIELWGFIFIYPNICGKKIKYL